LSPAAAVRRHAAAAGGLLLVALVVYAPALPADRTFWYRDIFAFWTALSAGFVRVVRAGSWPLWTPYPSFGLPLLADPGNQALYPFTWLNLLLPQPEWYKAFAVSHALLAATGVYALGLALGLSRAASFTSGALFLASGPFQSTLSHTVHFTGAAWMPWLLWAAMRALQRLDRGAALALGGVLAMQVLTGSGDLLIMSAFVAAPLFAAWLLDARRDTARLAGFVRTFALALALALLVSAGQWLPTLALIPESMRNSPIAGTQTYWSLHPWSLVELLAPRALTDLPMSEGGRAALYEGREPFWACLYLGAAAGVLVALGATRRGAGGGPLVAGLALSLLASLGRFTPFYPLLSQVTPLAFVRYPTKYALAAALFWALLAGRGVDAARDGRLDARRALFVLGPILAALAAAAFVVGSGGAPLEAWLRPGEAVRVAARHVLATKLGLAVLVALVACALARSASRRAASAWLLPALAIVDLLPPAQAVNAAAPRRLLEAPSRVAERVGEGRRLFVSAPQPFDWYPRQLARMPPGWQGPWALALGRQDMVAPPLGARWGLLGSYDGDVAGFAPPLLGNLTLIVTQAAGTPLALRLLQAGGVEYVVSLEEDRAWSGLEAAGEIQSVFRTPIRLLKVPEPRPRVYVVGAARVLDAGDAVRTLGSADFDPAREVVLGSGTPFGAPGEPFDGLVRELERRPDRLVVETEAGAPAVLVVLEAFHSGWRADVDGRSVPVARANALFRGVVLPPGRHRVTLAYRPREVGVGLALSAAGILGLGLLAISSRRSSGMGAA